MKLIVAAVLALGMALAGFAVYMAQGYMADMQSQRDQLLAAQAKAPRLVQVVVAKKALPYGTRFTREDLDTAWVQEGKIPEGAFNVISVPQDMANPPRAAFVDGETRPRAAMRAYEINEPLIEAKVTAPGVDAGILATIAPDMRAFTIDVDVTSGVSGFLRPGDRVDVYWSGKIGEQQVTKLIEPSLRLIAIDQSADADRTEETMIARTVTAEVTPEQVAALTLAQGTGRLNLSLVGATNSVPVAAIEIDRDKLLGIEAPVVAKVEEAKVCTIRTRKGAELIETPIPCAAN